MRPLGALTADIRGYRETLTAFASAGLVPPDTALAAGAVLQLLAPSPPADGRRGRTPALAAPARAAFGGAGRLLSLFPTPRSRVDLRPNFSPVSVTSPPAAP